MPNLTVRKSGRALKRKPSPTTRSNTTSSIKPTKKRVINRKFIHFNQVDIVDDDDEADDVQVIQEVPAAVQDVSGVIFTVMKVCMFGSVAVVEDTDFVCLREFSFRQFHTLTLRRVDKAAEEAKCSSEWLSGQAIISSKATRVADYLPITVEDESGWKKVEKGVERWMKETKKPVTVKLTIMYKRIGETIIDTSDDDAVVTKKVCTLQSR